MTNESARPESWEKLTPAQKREQRLKWWAETANEVRFISAAAAQDYKTRLRRLIDVYSLKEPDRVPVTINAGVTPLLTCGVDYVTATKDYEKAAQAYAQFNDEHAADLDSAAVPSLFSAPAVDILDYKLYSWPGHGLPASADSFQFNEGEYMRPDEYDAFIRNPSDFWMRAYLPRIFGVFEPFRQAGPLTDIIEFPMAQLMPLGAADVQVSLRRFLEAGQEIARFAKVIGDFTREVRQKGYPVMARNVCKAPFDTLGDTLRGTKGIMQDMFRQPEKLLEALDVAADLTVDSALNSPRAAKGFNMWFPLHKGADGWMSQKQFDAFYFPSLKKVMDVFIREGYIVTLFAEGSYNTRLDKFLDFPKGSVHWHFDRTDMARARTIFAGKFSIEGNVPASLLTTGNPGDVKEHCRKLIEVCGRGGGYILGAGAALSNPRLEALKAMVAAAKEYGVYKK